MPDLSTNPFQELYLTEALEDPELYLSWFSPTILTGQTEALFRIGNVVLSGTNGAGKTMLLRLFSPEVQAAHLRLHPDIKTEGVLRRVLGIGINFVHAGFSSLGKRTLRQDPRENLEVWCLLLGDLINYYLINELFTALDFLKSETGQPLAEFLGANVESKGIEDFSVWLAQQPGWFGYLQPHDSSQAVTAAIRRRLNAIRSFVNWNIERLPDDILRTKTEIGRPLADAREGLRAFGLLPQNIPLSVTIDQYETLLHIDYAKPQDLELSVGRSFCRVVNTFLARRDPAVSFKVGVRPYSWGRELRIHGSDALLELGRDYQRVDLDDLLRRGEDTTSWIFPDFARDVAARRLTATLGGEPADYKEWLPTELKSLTPTEEVARYSRRRQEPLVPRLGDWPPPWLGFLQRKYAADPFASLLSEVWMAQEVDRAGSLPEEPPVDDDTAPWNREYWQKERKEALLVQIASECRQRKIYAGWSTVITLSGGNILVFLSLCREIWDLGQRAASKAGSPSTRFSAELQSQAIWTVSAAWVRKQEEFPDGGTRKRFITRFGVAARKALIADRKLSYPGRTGFSISDDELDAAAKSLKDFLDSAADFGTLVKLRHTTKERDRRPRHKWYLFPVLCPQFDIPPTRTKEPYYASIDEIADWIQRDEPIALRAPDSNRKPRKGPSVPHPDLFT
jgi:hypothetical protein